MSTTRRATMLKLAATAYEMKLDVVNGVVARDDSGQWLIFGALGVVCGVLFLVVLILRRRYDGNM